MVAFFEFAGVFGGEVFAAGIEDDDAGESMFIRAIFGCKVAVVAFVHVDHDDDVVFFEL